LGFFRLDWGLLHPCNCFGGCNGRFYFLFWKLSLWRGAAWLFRGSTPSPAPLCGVSRWRFSVRLRFPFFSCTIFLMSPSSSTGAMLVYDFLPVHCIVNFARLWFVHCQNIHQILHVRIA